MTKLKHFINEFMFFIQGKTVPGLGENKHWNTLFERFWVRVSFIEC